MYADVVRTSVPALSVAAQVASGVSVKLWCFCTSSMAPQSDVT